MSDQRPSTDLAHAAAMPAPMGGALPTSLEWQALERMATMLADSNVIPYRLKKKPADVAVILLAAREYGIPPLMALSKLPVVNGTPAPMGELMVALVLRAGHYIGADFRNPDGTVYAGGPITPEHYGEARYKRRDWPEREVMRFTIAEAVTAGLIDRLEDGRAIARVVKFKDGDRYEEATPWEQYTPNMARWRSVANACRLTFPDVLLGLSYLPEELGATVDAEGAPIEGIVVDEPRRTAPPAATMEQRSAQEAADRLAAYVGPTDVLAKVLEHAQANGYAEERVTVPGITDAITLREAIAIRREWLDANTVGEHHAEEQQAAQEAAQGTQEGPAPSAATEETPEPEAAPQEAPQQETPGEDVDGIKATQLAGPDLALELARTALEEADAEALRGLWNMADAAKVLDVDVVPVVGDDDLAAINLTGTVRLPLRGLLIAANGYATKHGTAIRDLGEPFPGVAPAADTPDPWAQDAAASYDDAAPPQD